MIVINFQSHLAVVRYFSVEGHRVAQQTVDNIRVIVEHFVDHQRKYSHHGGATIIELDSALHELLLVGLQERESTEERVV